jgi:hypothetical protein
MTRRIAVIARPPSSSWRGPLRAFLDNRARELRDESAVRRVRLVDDAPALTLVIDFAHEFGASELVRDLVADLETLDAAPETAPESVADGDR